jgi:hypothetical protein
MVDYGGPGSGNFGHAGRPGKVGGSSGKGGGGTGKAEDSRKHQQQKKEGLEQGDAQGISEKDLDWPGLRGITARAALYDGLSSDAPTGSQFLSFRESDQVKGVALIESRDTNVIVQRLATAEKGYGAKIMKQIARSASEQKKGLELWSVADAVPFYKAIGMKQGSGNESRKFSFTFKEASEFAKS